MKTFKLALLFMLLSVLSEGRAALGDKKYQEYLLKKLSILENNIQNLRTPGYIPKDVIWDDESGGQVIPRPNPLVRVYEPENPKSNDKGMLFLPNLDEKKEHLRLNQIKEELRVLKSRG